MEIFNVEVFWNDVDLLIIFKVVGGIVNVFNSIQRFEVEEIFCINKMMFVDLKLVYGLGYLVIEDEIRCLREGILEFNNFE